MYILKYFKKDRTHEALGPVVAFGSKTLCSMQMRYGIMLAGIDVTEITTHLSESENRTNGGLHIAKCHMPFTFGHFMLELSQDLEGCIEEK